MGPGVCHVLGTRSCGPEAGVETLRPFRDGVDTETSEETRTLPTGSTEGPKEGRTGHEDCGRPVSPRPGGGRRTVRCTQVRGPNARRRVPSSRAGPDPGPRHTVRGRVLRTLHLLSPDFGPDLFLGFVVGEGRRYPPSSPSRRQKSTCPPRPYVLHTFIHTPVYGTRPPLPVNVVRRVTSRIRKPRRRRTVHVVAWVPCRCTRDTPKGLPTDMVSLIMDQVSFTTHDTPVYCAPGLVRT